VKNILHDFQFEADGATTLAEALCSFVKEAIAFGRIKGGDKFPTMEEISEATGLTFGQARRSTSLARPSRSEQTFCCFAKSCFRNVFEDMTSFDTLYDVLRPSPDSGG